MKKAIIAILALVLAGLMLVGCTAKAPAPLTADNEIMTYRKADLKKTQITISSLGVNANVRSLATLFEEQNPDIQVTCMDLTGGTTAYRPCIDWIINGVAPDVMFVNPDSFTYEEEITKYLMDLSTNPVIQNFEAEALNRSAVQGFVYLLPSPSEINCIIYNKTLFEKYGWEVPKNFDEFVALCKQISADTNGTVQPWNPNAKYDNVLTTALEAIAYEQVLGGKDNRSWYNDFCKGEATFAGHMEPFYDMVQTLIDNGILLEEHFNYSATTRGLEFQAGTIAMYNAPISRMTSDEYVFSYMPYPSTSKGLGYVNDAFSSLMCVTKAERTKERADAVDRFVAFFGTIEAQQAMMGTSLMVSNVKDVPVNDSEAMLGIVDVIGQGHKFSRMDFIGNGARSWSFRDNALAMVKGEKTGAQIIADIDAMPYIVSETDADDDVVLAEAKEDFTILEFSSYIADMYREKADADIGLINHLIPYRGNLVRLFKGNIYERYMYPIKPRSFANGSTLVKVSMTGKQLIDALNHPVGYECVSDSIYAFSGLKCEVAPWRELGSKYVSVKLSDGSAIDMDKLYTVGIWQGSVADEYITETLEVYEGTWEEIAAEKFKKDGTIAPAKDERIKLIWD